MMERIIATITRHDSPIMSERVEKEDERAWLGLKRRALCAGDADIGRETK